MPVELAVNVPALVPEQIVLLAGEMALANVQVNVVPEQGPVPQSLVVPKIVEPPVEVSVPVVSIVPVPATVTLPVALSKFP